MTTQRKTSTGTFKTRDGNACIKKICQHFGTGTGTSYSGSEGKVFFHSGELEMNSGGETLFFKVESDTFDGINKIKYALALNIERFTATENPVIRWEDYPVAPAPDWQEFGRQLAKPIGEQGRKIAVGMNHANLEMIFRAFELLDPANGRQILELGPGNGAHIQEIMRRWPAISYTGIEISETMIHEASVRNQGIRNVALLTSDGRSLPFSNQSFDRIVTVNTIYFWEDPLAFATEIRRALKKKGGLFSLAFVEKEFMEKLPFTTSFTLYTAETAGFLLGEAGFRIKKTVVETETIRSNTGEKIDRKRVVIVAEV